MSRLIFYLLIITITFFSIPNSYFCEPKAAEYSIVNKDNQSNEVNYALQKLLEAFKEKNLTYESVKSITEAKGDIILFIGSLKRNKYLNELFHTENRDTPASKESLSIWNTQINDKPGWIISGYDNRGLMYAILEISEHIKFSNDFNDPLSDFTPVFEKPDVKIRAVSMYTMNRNYWESRFYDENHWKAYLDMLAKNRFNSIVLIFGYENGGFLAPCYPYFFDVEGYPNVGMDGMTQEEQEKNQAALKRMIKLAHERGMEFKVAIWDHIYRGGIQTGGVSKDDIIPKNVRGHLVRGVTGINLIPYTQKAFTKFINTFPELDGIQFRMHYESGLKEGEETELFWTEMFKEIKRSLPHLKIDLRAKALPDKVIEIAADLNLIFTVTTKYWMEQMGLPFHPTHINRQNQLDRRHGYADLLRYPKIFDIHWRLWTAGTQRILLWGNPDYVRRFAESTHLYEGNGFEINEPLATKMDGQPHDAELFDILNEDYTYYTYEFERYWYYFNVFGRLTYNPGTDNSLLLREFNKRFGDSVGPILQKAIKKASDILPRINAACAPYSVFPTTRGWVAKQRLGDLEEFAKAEGSDIQQFASFDEEALLRINGNLTAKRLPSQTSLWFKTKSQEINELIDQIGSITKIYQNKELLSTLTDLKILANLAMYHSYRIPAAVSYKIFEHTNNINALDDAIAFEDQAINAWQNIVSAAGDIYADDLMFGSRKTVKYNIIHRLSGHWEDELPFMYQGLEKLKELRDNHKNEGKDIKSSYIPSERISNKELFDIVHEPINSAKLNSDLNFEVKVESNHSLEWVRLRYRAVTQFEDYKIRYMNRTDNNNNLYKCTVESNEINPIFNFMYFIEVMDENGNGYIYPDLEETTPYYFMEFER